MSVGSITQAVAIQYNGMTTMQVQAFQKAAELVKRNGPGDRETAISLLKTHFDNAFEVPV